MKNLRHLRIFIIPFFFSLFSCSENDKEHLTREITKVETSYFEGCSKVEGPTSIKKIETSAPDWFIQRSSDQAQEKINKLMQERSRTALARTIYSGYDVGVIPRYDACPSWSEKITIF